MKIIALLLTLWAGGVLPAEAAAQTRVALELVLAVDASSSVDEREFQLQVSGYVSALRDPDVIAAITAQRPGGIALTYVEWSSRFEQIQVVGWRQLTDRASVLAFSDAIRLNARQARSSGTAIGEAVIFSIQLLEENGFQGDRRVIDVSADDRYNAGSSPSYAKTLALKAGVQVNGLAIDPTGELTAYFVNNVIAGPGAFAIRATSYEDFARALKLKLLRELTSSEPIASLRRD